MDQRHRELIEHGDKLFSDRRSLDSFWQEAAEQFHPEMASFTRERSDGEDFAANLVTSYPLIARRTLGDTLSALLRPVSLDTTSPGVWFGMRTQNDDYEDHAARLWIERSTKIMRKAMYDRAAGFVRATKEGDHSFATFGQCIIQLGLNRQRNGLLYRSHHLKDVVWTENSEGAICAVHRRWNPTVVQLIDLFGDRVSSNVKTKASQTPHERVKIRHIVLDAEMYEQKDVTGKRYRQPWVSIWIDVDNTHVMEESGSFSRIYIIPRWVTVPGSQYASSPAVTAALPDARLIQAMTLTLLEAGEKFANPPMVAQQEVIRSDLGLYPGGVTWVDAEYDERLGPALRPVYLPTGGQAVGIGLQLRADIRESIAKAFFLDSLSLPPMQSRDRVTALEISERTSEWVRRAMPIFEPMEFEYNGLLCEETFELLMRNAGFGPYENIPASLRGAEIQFKFESPIHESVERRKGEKFMEAKAALIQAVDLDPAVAHMLDARTALRDIYYAIGVPMTWTRDEQTVNAMEEARQEKAQEQAMMEAAMPASEAIKNIGTAAKDMAMAQQPVEQAA